MRQFGRFLFALGGFLVDDFAGLVARFRYRREQRLNIGFAVDFRGVHGEIDVGFRHARHGAQGFFHVGDAAGAAHAVDGETNGDGLDRVG